MSESNEIKRPLAAVGVYVLNEKNQILLLRRTSRHAFGFWCAPGGHIEFGESFFEAAKREAKEEAGIEIEQLEIVGLTNDFYRKEGKHSIVIHLKATSWSGLPQICESNKASEISWFDLNVLPEPLLLSNQNFFEADYNCLCGSGKKYKQCHGK